MASWAWIPFILFISTAAALIASLASALLWAACGDRLCEIAPRPRFALLAGLVLLPLIAGLAAPVVVFTPSLLDLLGVVADHCADHAGHAFHLCFVHGHPPATTGLWWSSAVAVAFAAVGWLLVSWNREAMGLWAAGRWARRLAQLSSYDEGLGLWVLSSQRSVALTVGLLRPSIFITERMRELLAPAHLAAVIAHERAHAGRRDGLLKAVARLGAPWQLPGVRGRLLEELELAGEQACDEAAAAAVGDRLTVAEAILAVERQSISPASQAPLSVLSFGAGALERRVSGLIDAPWRPPRWRAALLLGFAALVALGNSYASLHHAVEALLAQMILS